MKIINFWGGLGNQIFEYAYYKWLQNRYTNEKIYGYYPSKGLKDHNGLEIHKRFNVSLPPTSFFTNIIGSLLFNAGRVSRRLHLPFIMTCNQSNERYEALFHCDYWQDKKYEVQYLDMRFNLHNIGCQNLSLLSKMENANTVAIHVRRGDYLNSEVASIYGGICTEEYYSKALDIIRSKVKNPMYIFFSDDTQYVKDTFHLDNMTIVDWNKGENSIFDMYLMSRCKYMILANSSFSYWAARLNEKVEDVICPGRWFNKNSPDIILDNWIKI